MKRSPRVLVFAYSDVGYECLEALIEKDANVVGVFTHHDKPSETIWFRCVADLALRHNIPVFKDDDVNQPSVIEQIKNLAPDIIFSFYYRQMICDEILNFASLGAYNMHGSLLPKYRGRAPVNWAVIMGEEETGVTLHKMVKRADAGDIVAQEKVRIEDYDHAIDVFHKVTKAARVALSKNIEELFLGTAKMMPQDNEKATKFGGRKPQDGQIDWQYSTKKIYDLIRGVSKPFPGAFSFLQDQKIIFWDAQIETDFLDVSLSPGQIISVDPMRVKTIDGALKIISFEQDQYIQFSKNMTFHFKRI